MHIRQAETRDHAAIAELVIDSFEPVTWARPLDAKFGPLNGLDWRARWRLRMEKILTEQTVLVAEAEGAIVAVCTFTLDRVTAVAYIDILAVAGGRQHRGTGREMLRATLDWLRALGMRHVNLDCLTTNDNANALYASEGFEEVARHIRWFRAI